MQTKEEIETFNENLELSGNREITGAGFRRRPVLAHDRNESAAALVAHDRRTRVSRGVRKRLLMARSYVLTPVEGPVEPKVGAVKFAVKLTTLKLTQLFRRQAKFARLASTAKHILVKMSPGPSRLKSHVETQQGEALGCLGQVTAEIQARNLAAQGKLAAA